MKTNLKGLHDLPFADYLKLDAINKSSLDDIHQSPAHFQYRKANPEEPTDAMILGSATHHGVLQPELLYKEYFARPDGIDGRTKEGKAKLEELGKANVGKTMLKAPEFAMIEGMMKAARSHKVASRLLSGGQAEVTAISQDPEFGLTCKARPDYVTTGDTLIDLKTTNDVSFFSFQRQVRDFRYHVQAAWYLDVVNAAIGKDQYKRFVLVAVEKEAPYGIMIYEMDPVSLKLGRAEARRDLKTYAECLKSNVWPCYTEATQIMTIPTYE